MYKSLENKLRNYLHPYITDVELKMLLEGSPDSQYSKVKRLLAQGKLMHIRRGLYCLTEVLGHSRKPHPFMLAQYIYAPSYISLESALAYHNLIPEAVYVTTSVCTKRSKEFHSTLGVFSYLHLPVDNFYIEVELITNNNDSFFMAKPWKAICDYIFCYKKEWYTIDPLLKSLRINRDDLPILCYEEIEVLNEYYHNKRLTRFLTGIKRDLKL